MLNFQKMDVYQRSVELATLSIAITGTMARGNAGLRDQLRRAAFSIPLNIAEGTGRVTEPDAARHYAIALAEGDYQRGIELLSRLVAMLTKLCR